MLIANVSHDLMTPLNAIQVFSNELYRACGKDQKKKAHKYYNLIQNSVKFAILKRNDMQDNGLLENGFFTKCF